MRMGQLVGLNIRNSSMQDRNIINGTSAVIFAPLADFYQTLWPFILVAIILIVADLRFGIEAAKKRGETIRTSRMWRRTINKLVDYICWITLAGAFGATFGDVLNIPILSAIIILIIYGIELSSCFNNYFEARGWKFRINVFKLFGQKKLEDAVEQINEKERDDGDDK